MNKMRSSIIFIALVFVFFGCSNNDVTVVDELEATGILGSWEINSRSFNSIEPLIVVCCEFIDFEVDRNKGDFSGNYNWFNSELSGSGSFKVNESSQILLLQDDDNTREFEFIISQTRQEFELVYMDSQNTIIREIWIRTN